MSLTAAQRADMQGDLGVSADETVFTDAELERLFERAEGDYNTAVYFGYRQLLAQANKFHNYTVGMTRVERNQMRENLRDSMQVWADLAEESTQPTMRLAGLRGVPPKGKDEPIATGWR